MTVDLEIRDGSPAWYFSPDIWVVSGNDPSGPQGSPIAGQPADLWARVANNGSTDASGVRVDFYWANPALQVTRSNATFVGSAFADVDAGTSQDALCLVPWMPTIVNGGHECLVAVANHSGDPLPSPLPDAFDPPTYSQVAQKNLTVVALATAQVVFILLTVSGLERSEKNVRLEAETGGKLDTRTLAGLGLEGLRPARKGAVEVGLSRELGCVREGEHIGEPSLELHLPRERAIAVRVALRSEKLKQNEYQFVHVAELDGKRALGGIGLVVVRDEKAQRDDEAAS
jgi:hypothetical protein